MPCLLPVGRPLLSTFLLEAVERFTRVNADTLDYRVTVDDPRTWTRPGTVAFPLKQRPDS